jgi:type VI secretion system protein ImpF
MAHTREASFSQSLMDRLSERQEWPNTQAGSLRVLKESIRRDLEAVLNTRRCMTGELNGYELAAASVLNYGLEDLSSFQTNPDGHLMQMQRAVQQCLAEYEPRLVNVSVSVQDGDLLKREIRLHIEAQLPLYPSVEIVSFDTVFDVTTERYSVG